MKHSFSLIEVIFVIVIIGILAAVAVPRFKGLTQNSKISSELATASTIQSAIDDVHSEWVMSEGHFTWGNGKNENDINSQGYPNKLGDCPPALNWILRNHSTVDREWECKDNGDGTFYYKGPASKKNSGVHPSSDKAGKPDCSDYWEYNASNGSFTLVDKTDQTCTSVNDL